MKKRFFSFILAVLIMQNLLFTNSITVSAASAAETLHSIAVQELNLGTSGRPNKYTYWYGSIGGSYSYDWCHAFVSWCGNEAGILGTEVPRTAGVEEGLNWYSNKGKLKYRSSGYIPKGGDVVYFDLNQNNSPDHVGIVDYSDGRYVYTIEGNSGGGSGAMRYHTFEVNSTDILAYGVVSGTSGAVTSKPSAPVLTTAYDLYKTSDSITISWNSISNASSYWLHIYDKNGNDYVNKSVGTATSFTTNYAAGKYTAYVAACNSAGEGVSSGLTFSVYSSKPTKPSISGYKSEYSTSESFSIKWTNDGTAHYYWLHIYDENAKDYKNYSLGSATSYSHTFPVGKYTIYITAINAHGETTANAININVGKYTVTLNNQSATTAGTTSVTATYGSAMPSITVPKKTGYTFGGYYTEKNGAGTQYYKADGTSAKNWDKTSATTLYAKWTANKYTVTLNNQSATTAGTASVSATYGSAMPSITAPKKTGYTFGGYYTETNGSGTQYYKADGTSAKNWDKTSATTLYAKWTANKYTVTLNNQSATTAGTTSVSATYGSAMPSITVPKKTGYTFGGYYTETNGSGTQYYKADGTSAKNWDKTSATTLYAKWTANKYTVTLNNQSATTAGTTSVSATYGSAMPSITVPKKTGYTFGGYYTETNGAGTQYYKADGTSAKNWDKTTATTLYAKWTANKYTVTFKNYDGTVLETKSVDYGSTVTYSGTTPTKKADAQYTYTFAGWDKALTNITANTVITANFTSTVNKYTVTFKNYDSTVLESKTLDYGATIAYSGTIPTKPVDEQCTYAFLGWDKTLGTVTGNMEFIAQFIETINHYTVTFDANGGSGAPTSQIKNYGETLTLSNTKPSRTGHIFKNWNTKADGSGDSYNSGSTYTNNASVTLYAQWEQINIPVNGITLDKTDVTLSVGDTATLVPTITPDNATNKNVTWKSTHTGIATVENGIITAISAGRINICATTEDGGYYAICTVNVVDSVAAQGKCGNNVSWTFYESGKLVINGIGDMYDYENIINNSSNCVPWYDYKNNVTDIWVTGKVTRIGEYAFFNHPNLSNVEIDSEVKSLGKYAFSNCASLSELVLPNSVSEFGEFAFCDCSKLKTIAFSKKIETISFGAFYGCSLSDVYFYGRKEDWNALTIYNYNTTLSKATIHFTEPYTISIVTKSGAKLIIDTKVHNIIVPYDILIVSYKSNKFVTMKRVPHNEQNSPYTFEGDIDEIKVMVWSDLSTLKPLCEAEEITSDKFIIE